MVSGAVVGSNAVAITRALESLVLPTCRYSLGTSSNVLPASKTVTCPSGVPPMRVEIWPSMTVV